MDNIIKQMLSHEQRKWTVDLSHLECWKATPLATELQMVLQERMQDCDYMGKLKPCRASPAVAAFVDYIDSTFF